ncbi:hypothetical protein NL53_06305 [Vibrio variabilis]|uniref:Uncharacterized protein n=1 Tax=Vibrio variabilis TaxID=990271 RepID=A0ABR4YCM7_9VIBR|nr:hypothetical protein [Vibrio variabilis]KHA61246.1 hypothetical protein NL53_06305 [Vibrio variabilis]
MSELIQLGLKQGSVVGFSAQLTTKSDAFSSLEGHIKKGRYGVFEPKGVALEHLYVVLTQDCTISTGKHIELAQLKKKKVKEPSKVEHLLLGKDYSKLFLHLDGIYYELEESLLTKVKSEVLLDNFREQHLEITGQLSQNDTRKLLDWRTLAYFREPYPDGFNRALAGYLREQGQWFIAFLQKNAHTIHSLRVYVTPDEEIAEEYQFSITALLNPEGEEIEEEIASNIDTMLTELNKCPNIECIQSEGFDAEGFDFPDSLVLSLTSTLDEFTFANAYVMREYNFQYLCY